MKAGLIAVAWLGLCLVAGTALAIDTVPLPEKPAQSKTGTKAIGTWPTPEKTTGARNTGTRNKGRVRRPCRGPRCPGRGKQTRPRPGPR